jgi:DNA-binding FrmR family transcriptional regulator
MKKGNEQSALIHRLNRIQGQVEGLKRVLMEKDADCVTTMGQVKAVHSAIKHFGEAYIETYAGTCAKKERVSSEFSKNMRTMISSAFLL